jgi:LacI family transcriptional regulator
MILRRRKIVGALMNPIRIGLVFVHSFFYYRGALRGIRRFLDARPQWHFTSLVPEQQSLCMPGQFRPEGLLATVNSKLLVRALASWRRPVVNVSAVLPGLRYPRVGADNVQIGQLAAAHFLERGLRHFGFIGRRGYLFSMERRASFGEAVQQAGYRVACYELPAHVSFDPLGRRWDLDRAVIEWLQRLPKPVGVFVPHDSWGVQVAEACHRAALRVPEDVAILGVDDDHLYCELARPPLSSIILPVEQIGYEAAALLERLLGGEKPPREPILLPPTGVATRRSTEVLAIDDPELVAAVRYIREHAHLPLRVTDVLQEVTIGRRTLEERFRRTLGWGLGEEIRRTHMERARRLLMSTDLPMKLLATRAGFSDYRHMAIVFRQELGISPTTYRRQMRSPISLANLV